jgi:hypothetical protein
LKAKRRSPGVVDALTLQIDASLGHLRRAIEHLSPEPQLAAERDRLLDKETMLTQGVDVTGRDLLAAISNSRVRPCAGLPRTAPSGVHGGLCLVGGRVVVQRELLLRQCD